MIDKNILLDLQEIVNGSIDPTLFPYQKGNSIRIGNFAIRVKDGSHKVFDCENNKLIAETFSKSAAVALARTRAKGRSFDNAILDIDFAIQKWYNDCIFYKNTIKKSKDSVKKEVVYTRYEMARDKTNHARRELDKYIYSV